MITCSIKGCSAEISELLSTDTATMKRWIILRACRCGAFDARNKKSCTCTAEPGRIVPIQYWPNLDWWMLGGVDELTLCPDHKHLVKNEIMRQRGLDPSMDSGHLPNPTNRH
jgi:hypothetical protein